MRHSIDLVTLLNDLGMEGCQYELRWMLLVFYLVNTASYADKVPRRYRFHDLSFEQFGHRSPVKRIERGIDLVEEVERRRIASLNGKDESESHESLLSARKLLERHRFSSMAEAHLVNTQLQGKLIDQSLSP